jgi:alpha-aminoadipic semialdehyde synthase
MGFEGHGILDMAVDILPSELPRESSESFGNALEKFVYSIATANYELPFENIDLPFPIRKAMILHRGELTPEYAYLKDYVKK